MSSVNSLSRPFPRISIAHIEGTARSVRHRQQQFHKLHKALVEAKSSLTAAIKEDYGYSETEASFEYAFVLAELHATYGTISLEAENAAARRIEQGLDNMDRRIGAGIVYIRPDMSRTSLYSTVSPLSAAMAAGNCVIVEVSPFYTP